MALPHASGARPFTHHRERARSPPGSPSTSTKGQGRVAVTTTRTHFAFRIDLWGWGPNGESIVEHLAGAEDFKLAMATYQAACERWPKAAITLRQGARVGPGPHSRRLRLVWSDKGRQGHC